MLTVEWRLSWLSPVPKISVWNEPLALRRAADGGLDCGLDIEAELIADRLTGERRAVVAVAQQIDRMLRDDPQLSLRALARRFRCIHPILPDEAVLTDQVTTLVAAAFGPFDNVRLKVLCNPHMPEWVLEEFCESRRPEELAAIASNPGLPERLASRLLGKGLATRLALVHNPNVPQSLLEDATKLGCWSTAWQACEHERATMVMVRQAVRAFGQNRAPLKNLYRQFLPQAKSPEVLERMSRDRSPRLRQMTAMNRHLSEEVALRLARDPDDGVRQELASNLWAPACALIALAGDPNPRVRYAVSVNEKTPRAAAKRFLPGDQELRNRVLQRTGWRRKTTALLLLAGAA